MGAAVSVLAVARFVVAFSAGNWGAALANSETLIIGLYGPGILVMAAGSIFTPLLTGRDREQAAAEARAGNAEAKRDAAMDEIGRSTMTADARTTAGCTESEDRSEAPELSDWGLLARCNSATSPSEY